MFLFCVGFLEGKAKNNILKTDVESVAGNTINIKCSPPISAEALSWTIGGNIIISNQTKLSFQKDGNFSNGILQVQNVEYQDRNDYICVIQIPAVVKTNYTVNATEICKAFRLRVRDPLGAVWPTIGIVAEAVVLFAIIASTEYFAKRVSKGFTTSLGSGGNKVSYGSFKNR